MSNANHIVDYYRANRCIRLGEWFDDHKCMLDLITDRIATLCMEYCEDDKSAEYAMCDILDISSALNEVQKSYKKAMNTMPGFDEFRTNPEVYTEHPMACRDHRKTVIAKWEEKPEAKPKTTKAKASTGK